VIEPLVVVPPEVVSVAVSVQLVALLMMTLGKVAVLEDATSVRVPPKLHVDEIVIESVAVPPAVMLTSKLVSATPAVPVPGTPENDSVAVAADAGDAARTAAPPMRSADTAPIPITDLSVDRNDRLLVLRPISLLMKTPFY